MKFRTTVETGMKGLEIRPGDGLTLLGSCFADHIGRRMVQSGLDAHANPFGVLYNPLSISVWCRAMATVEPLPEDIFFESGGLWHSWLNDSSFSAENREECRARLENVRREEAARFRSLKVLLDVEGAKEVLGEALGALWQVNPSLQIVFTVSPYRYAKYGFHGSRLGKAVLLLAVDGICRAHEGRCFYFPAYEIVLDELRDYRFYAADMLHPSEVAVGYIWERFSEVCFPVETRSFMAEWEAVAKALSHRPLHPESAAYRDFLRQTMLKMERLTEKYPKLADTTEYGRLKDLLKY